MSSLEIPIYRLKESTQFHSQIGKPPLSVSYSLDMPPYKRYVVEFIKSTIAQSESLQLFELLIKYPFDTNI